MSIQRRSTQFHGLSIDVEDWFHILDCHRAPTLSDWDSLEVRVIHNTAFILDILNRYQLKATFFILGWAAQRYPDLVTQIVDQGHEIGSHGHFHRIVSTLTPDEFARDLDASLAAIERAANRDVQAYRAPGFSITPNELWTFEILASRGIHLDSSLFLAPHAHGGFTLHRKRPFEILLPSGRKITEVPIVPYWIGNVTIPFSGGGYLRLFPTAIAKRLFQLAEQTKTTIVTYLHPRDFDANQPRMALSAIRYFKYYVGLKTFPRKFETLLRTVHFNSLGTVAATTQLDQPLLIHQLDQPLLIHY